MGFSMDMPEELGGSEGNWLKTPGKYHFSIEEIDENPKKKNGELIDGFRVAFGVLNEGDEKGKKIDITFHNPKLNARDGGKWARAKQAAFLIASGLVHPSQLGKRVDVNLQDAKFRQVLVEVEYDTDDDGNPKANDKGQKFLQLAWANVYHVDDPRASEYAKNEAALRALPASLRLEASAFDALKGGGSSSGGDSKPPTQEKPSVDLGDL